MQIVVIGAGAAGMVAAAAAAERRADVVLLEKNSKAGVKILMSGGTRCNLTHDTDARGITQAFGKASRFLQPSVYAFPPDAVTEMCCELGVATKTESTGKIFPKSDRDLLDVRDALNAERSRPVASCGCDLPSKAYDEKRFNVASRVGRRVDRSRSSDCHRRWNELAGVRYDRRWLRLAFRTRTYDRASASGTCSTGRRVRLDASVIGADLGRLRG